MENKMKQELSTQQKEVDKDLNILTLFTYLCNVF